jgi:hypothetical protein
MQGLHMTLLSFGANHSLHIKHHTSSARQHTAAGEAVCGARGQSPVLHQAYINPALQL